jgi:succinyl-CoA synthetase alpha subunit
VSILIDKQTKVIVQGITGRDGSFHTQAMLDYGTQILAGVTPGKGGQQVGKIPVYDTVKEAVAISGAECSVMRSVKQQMVEYHLSSVSPKEFRY